MTRLIWRQHRGQALWAVIAVAVLCALAVYYGLSAERWLSGYRDWLHQLAAAGCPPPDARSGTYHVNSPGICAALKNRYPGSLQAAFASQFSFATFLSLYGMPAAFAIIGAMVGAPLVAREVEQRTQLVAWTQAVSRRRWYFGKIAALAIGLAVLGLIAGTANGWLQRQLTAGDNTSSRWTWFTSANLALAGEVVLAFALAVAFGALLRRTLPAIGSALAGFIALLLAIRWAVVALTPTSKTTGPHFTAPSGSWLLGSGAGGPVPYHPAGQFLELQLILVVVMLAVAAAVLASGWHETRTRAI